MTTLPPRSPSFDRAADLEQLEQQFPSLHLTRSSRSARRLGRLLLWVLLFASLAALFAPWQQSIRGEGNVIAFDPYERPQPVQALIKGLIAERGDGVFENAYVEKGQLLFRIQDQDPNYLERLRLQVENARKDLELAESNLEQARRGLDFAKQIVEVRQEEIDLSMTAQKEAMAAQDEYVKQAEKKLAAERHKLEAAEAKKALEERDYKRQSELFEDGLASELKLQQTEQKYKEADAYVDVANREVETAVAGVEAKKRERESKRSEWDAKIRSLTGYLEKERGDIAKAQAEIAKASQEINQKQSKLLDTERKFSAQQTQEVKAPVAGYIQQLDVFDGVSVKPGDQLCMIVPTTDDWAVEVWVDGNDQPLISPGRHARLQFEGWPAVQFSGWPSVAVGTFGGEVALVNPTSNGQGKFRVLIRPDEQSDWPDHPYLRQGVRANAWVLLETVPLGYEIWRRMNGFPPALQSIGNDPDKIKTPKLKL
ncbi:HlyD family efflux transporter periplasmic adaptor subunit [Botrimarina sp.]|uniref:HlyD family secretion protein n=1 Tax=Botrimarina sp. TaxID=2795802 RepID=UPI0032EF240C